MLLSNLMLEKGTLKFGQLPNKATGQIELLSFAGMLWEVFKGLLSRTFNALQISSLKEVLEAMQEQFKELLNQAKVFLFVRLNLIFKRENKNFA